MDALIRSTHPEDPDEIVELRARLEEAEETLRALRSGEVDALVIGDQIYTLESSDAASNRFRGEVLAQINDAVISVDNENRITYINPAAERQYDVKASEVLGRRLAEIYDHQWPEPGSETTALTALRERGSWQGENIHVKRNGDVIHVESNVTVLHDPAGEITGTLAVIRDISERKRADEELLLAHESLESRVVERTIELSQANQALKSEMAERAAAEKHLAELLEKIVTSQEVERRRIARDIHDQLGQRVTALRLQIASLSDLLSEDDLASVRVAILRQTAETLDADVSFLAWQLRPASLDDLGLTQAIKEFIQEWSHHYKIDVDFILRGLVHEKLTNDAETQFYRIMQEALNNVAKHANATRVNILLESDRDQVRMIIEDNGSGFDRDMQKQLRDKQSLGLLGMKERALLIGANVEIESSIGAGTTIYVRAPAVAVVNT
jgi:two-component system, chemotaxis family, CheB/CheR fusion protein